MNKIEAKRKLRETVENAMQGVVVAGMSKAEAIDVVEAIAREWTYSAGQRYAPSPGLTPKPLRPHQQLISLIKRLSDE